MKDTRQRAFVKGYFRARCEGVQLLDFDGPKLPLDDPNAKEPDFTVEFDDGTTAFAELKSIDETDIDDDKAGWSDDLDGALRRKKDNGVARIGRDIRKAHKQLKEYPRPWIVILLNEDSMVDYWDFKAVFTGTVEYTRGDGEIIYETSAMKVARGEGAELRYEIDLYLWIDRQDENKLAPLATSEPGRRPSSHARRAVRPPGSRRQFRDPGRTGPPQRAAHAWS